MAALEVVSSTALIIIDKGGLINPVGCVVLAVLYAALLISALNEIDNWITDWND